MGYLTVISETGCPHSACMFEFHGKKLWGGFKPRIPKTPTFWGYVDTSDRTKYIKNFACFSVSDSIIQTVVIDLEGKYRNLWYTIAFGIDCMDFSVDAAKWCGLQVPNGINLFPDPFVKKLTRLNTHILLETSVASAFHRNNNRC